MPTRLEQLRKQLEDWLRTNALDNDLHFVSPKEWNKRREDYLNDAKLVITSEGQLCFLLNYAFDHPIVDEFQDLLASFGFWFDMGHSWSIGIYEDEYDDKPTPTDYGAKCHRSLQNQPPKIESKPTSDIVVLIAHGSSFSSTVGQASLASATILLAAFFAGSFAASFLSR